jgi:hypothetical protein
VKYTHKYISKISENYYPRLNENPNAIWDVKKERIEEWKVGKDIAFTYTDHLKKEMIVSKDTHGDISREADIESFGYRGRGVNSGRIFVSQKVISFWAFPKNNKDLIKTLADVEKAVQRKYDKKLNLLTNKKWTIEIPVDKQEAKNYPGGWGDWYPKKNSQKFISIDQYKKRIKRPPERSPEELQIRHLIPPAAGKKEVPPGFGSKSPKYQSKRQWQMATVGDESVKEPISTKLNEGSQIIKYIKDAANMTSGAQKKFWQWKLKNAKLLTHVKTDEIRQLYPEIDEHLKNSHYSVEQKQCYKNAGQLCLNVEGVSYVEGEISLHGIPIEHAWNKIDGKYFDITKDILFGNASDYAEYVKIIELEMPEYAGFILKHKHWGGFIVEKYQKDHKLDKVEESFYPKLFEGVADKYAEKEFHIINPDTEFERKYKTKQIIEEEKDKIIYKSKNYKDYIIVKNPTTLKNFDDNVRGVISQNGDLYFENKEYNVHDPILQILKNKKEIKYVTNWHLKLPTKFLTVQRANGTNYITCGESNEPLRTKNDKVEECKLTRETSLPVYKKFMTVVAEKNPQFTFYPDLLKNLDPKLLESKQELHYPKLFECPDRITYGDHTYHYAEDNASPFEVVLDDKTKEIIDVLVSKETKIAHMQDTSITYVKEGTFHAYPGRLFFDPKVITFWSYPSGKELKTIIEKIEEKTNIKIFDNDWKIEIYKNAPKGTKEYWKNYRVALDSSIIPIEDYIDEDLQSSNASQEDYLRHLAPPSVGKKLVPQ